jgi:hypothetical protein
LFSIFGRFSLDCYFAKARLADCANETNELLASMCEWRYRYDNLSRRGNTGSPLPDALVLLRGVLLRELY